MKSMGKAIPRLVLAIVLFAGAFLIPARSSAVCAFECWPSTWLEFAGDCFEGRPETCRSCLMYCFSPV